MSTVTRPTPVRLDQQVEIETPEQVAFSYTVAGVGSRAAAALTDYALMAAMLIVLWLLTDAIERVTAIGSPALQRLSGAWIAALLILVWFAIQWGYYVLFEAIWDGQTPGKRWVGIRVVQDGGYSVSFGASAVRNIVRIIDMQPGLLYAVGIISSALSRSGKRLGDMAAGTFVVQERVLPVAQLPARPDGVPDPAPITAALTPEEFELLDRFVSRSGSLAPERRWTIAEQLVDRFQTALAGDTGKPMAQLARLHEREAIARARGAAARGTTGAARDEHAIIARNAARWSTFAALLASVQRRGLRAMSETEVSEFVAQYREVATDLARLQTASHGRDNDSLFRVSRLVGAGHNLLYRQRTVSLRTVRRYVFGTVPREIRRSAVPILGAALLMFGPMAITYRAVVTHPAAAGALVGPAMVDRANEGVARAQHDRRTYIQVGDYQRPSEASAIISRNVQVTYAAFAGGITAGIGTIFLLVLNGISIGAVFGLYMSKGIFMQIGEFIIPHSVFELSAICIAGGAGLLIAAALWLPGRLTRREALVVNGRRAIALITASTMLLVVSGTIEGLISPRTDISIAVKLGVAGACALTLISYISLGGRAAREEPGEEFGYSDARALTSR